MSRYLVVEGSQSWHCCFDWTVVDTTQPVIIAGDHYKGQFEAVCECFEQWQASEICEALNEMEKNK